MDTIRSENHLPGDENHPAAGTSSKPAQSGNLSARPEAQTWAGILHSVTNMAAEDLAAVVGGNQTELGRQLLLLPSGVSVKQLLAIRIVMAMMSNTSSSLWRVIAELKQVHVLEERVSELERAQAE